MRLGVARCQSQHQCHFWQMSSMFEGFARQVSLAAVNQIYVIHEATNCFKSYKQEGYRSEEIPLCICFQANSTVMVCIFVCIVCSDFFIDAFCPNQQFSITSGRFPVFLS